MVTVGIRKRCLAAWRSANGVLISRSYIRHNYFDFDLDQLDGDPELVSTSNSEVQDLKDNSEPQDKSKDYSLQDFLSTLPEAVALSFVSLTLPNGTLLKLPRRELFDVRLQLMSQDQDTAMNFANAPSDLLEGIYEGGLKTWECSLDLASYLAAHSAESQYHNILELGCGSALPTLYLFHRHLSSTRKAGSPITFHVQDYNAEVLQLITLPNMILTWYFSPIGKKFRQISVPEEDASTEDLKEVELSPELISAFQYSLSELEVSFSFTSGSWSRFKAGHNTGYDLVLTSETIYRPSSYGDLISLLKGLPGPYITAAKRGQMSPPIQPEILVAAKLIYFGVGGGIVEFSRRVKAEEGNVQEVWSHKGGIGRAILCIVWP